MKRLIAVATLGSIGYMPFPGTMGSIVAFLILYPLRLYSFSLFLFAFVVSSCVGYYAIDFSLDYFNVKDPSIIVFDEVLGVFTSLLLLPVSSMYVILLFLLFRFFDITKIVGISWFEKLPGAVGVIADDVIAGMYALCACLFITLYVL